VKAEVEYILNEDQRTPTGLAAHET
jgi:hypothetical protein